MFLWENYKIREKIIFYTLKITIFLYSFYPQKFRFCKNNSIFNSIGVP